MLTDVFCFFCLDVLLAIEVSARQTSGSNSCEFGDDEFTFSVVKCLMILAISIMNLLSLDELTNDPTKEV